MCTLKEDLEHDGGVHAETETLGLFLYLNIGPLHLLCWWGYQTVAAEQVYHCLNAFQTEVPV